MSTIQNLLVDKSFLELDRQLNAFNIFDVLNVREYEIRHTRFLAHMLDPYGTHGMGSAFLRNFLLQLSVQLGTDKTGDLLGEVHQLDLDLARVTPEISFKKGKDELSIETTDGSEANSDGGRLDIVLQIPRRGGGEVVIAIENKINAREGDGQLPRYRHWMHERFGAGNSVLVFLTVNEEEPRDGWHCVTYSNVVYPALELTAQSCDTLGPGPAMLIDHYRSILRDKVEGDAANADADSLALELVDNYPDAKKFIDATCNRWGGRLGLEAVDSSWGLYNRYKNAFSFLAGYDSDERAKVLRWFKNKWPNQVAGGSVTPHIFIDDSGRSIMRFLAWPAGSALAELSRKYALKTKENKKYAWTSGKHAVLFELRSYVIERPQSTGSDEAEFGWNLFLVIGPLEDIDRNAWITRLRNTLNGHFSTRAGECIPTVRHAAITATFFSLLKWELKGRNVATLTEELSNPALLTCIADVARIIERTMLEEDDATKA